LLNVVIEMITTAEAVAVIVVVEVIGITTTPVKVSALVVGIDGAVPQVAFLMAVVVVVFKVEVRAVANSFATTMTVVDLIAAVVVAAVVVHTAALVVVQVAHQIMPHIKRKLQ